MEFSKIPMMSKEFLYQVKIGDFTITLDLTGRFFRTIFINIKNKGIVSGASTITMQLSRIVTPQKKSVFGKFFEIINAIRIEGKLSKNKILELYLNSIPFGFNAIGVESASKTFFAKSFVNLTPEELVVLSIIPRSPQKFNPITSKDQCIELATKIQKNIKFKIEPKDIVRAVKDAKSYRYEYNANHFVNFIKKDINKSNNSLYKSSLDLKLNEYIETNMRKQIDGYKQNRLTNGARDSF